MARLEGRDRLRNVRISNESISCVGRRSFSVGSFCDDDGSVGSFSVGHFRDFGDRSIRDSGVRDGGDRSFHADSFRDGGFGHAFDDGGSQRHDS